MTRLADVGDQIAGMPTILAAPEVYADTMANVVRNEPENNRYVIERDGEQLGMAQYRIHGDQIVFIHTEVDTDRRERGLASELVQAALDDVRSSSGRRVVAQCPYVARWLTKHPDYQDLLSR